MQMDQIIEKTAAYLAVSDALWDQNCTVVTRVRPQDLTRDGGPTACGDPVDLLICRRERVLLGISCGTECTVQFNRHLSGLPILVFTDTDGTLPLGSDDEDWLEFPAPYRLSLLAEQVAQELRKPERGPFFCLNALPPQEVLPDTGTLFDDMAAKCLLHSDLSPTRYGSAHGLFLRYSADPFGDLHEELLTVPSAKADLQAVLSWRPAPAGFGVLPLAQRKEQLAALPDGGSAALVQALLEAPMDVLLQEHPALYQDFLALWRRGNFLLYADVPDFEPTYRESALLIRDLGRSTREPQLDPDETAERLHIVHRFLLLMAQVAVSPPPQSAPASGESMPLHQRLGTLRRQSVFGVFGLSLMAYYQAVSYLSGCAYPNWVYRTRIRVLYENRDKPEASYTLRFLAKYCQLCYEDPSVDDREETYPLLYDLFLMPVCTIHS